MTETLQNDQHHRDSNSLGFSLIELLVVLAILSIVMGSAVRYISIATKRSLIEQTKVDLSQEAREFVDEFERDIHQSGYPNCRMFSSGAGCNLNSDKIAAGLVSVSNTSITFEGDVDGDGSVNSVSYQLIDQAGNSPPTGNCPCIIQRSQIPKALGTAPLAQGPPQWSQELQNVVNSGTPVGGAIYGGGLNIAGNTAWGATNTAYYAAVATFKDYPVFSAYDQSGLPVTLPVDISTPAGQTAVTSIASIRLTLNLIGNATTGVDMQTNVRPVLTLVGSGRVNNN
jgi:prepilin-type N-terminal cleavage/methylation domain-containing protein